MNDATKPRGGRSFPLSLDRLTPVAKTLVRDGRTDARGSSVPASATVRPTSADAQLTMVFRLAARRRPRPDELAVLREYHDAQVARFTADPAAAGQLLAVGVTRPDPRIDPLALAALTNVTTVVMNTPDAYSLR